MKRYIVTFLCLTMWSDLALTNDLGSILVNETLGKISNFKLTNIISPQSSLLCSNDPEDDMTVVELIKNSGYPVEEHFVTTEDGYILGVHRIRGEPGSPAALLYHGMMDSSFAYIASGKTKSLAYKLSDRGYDVWMPNIRGNIYSRNHTTLLPSDREFWNFSFHEVGVYDLPAVIDYVRSIKNDGKKLMYVGVSMGTTVFFVMASQRPDVASKVEVMFALAPAAYVEHVKGLMKLIAKPALKVQSRMTLILSHTPAGTSLKTLFHLGFGVLSKKFRQYDYQSPAVNLKFYNSTTPPDYDLGKIQVPVAVFWAENDFLTPPPDVRRLWNELPNKIEINRINDPEFTHLDFIAGLDAPRLVHPKLFELMDKYRKNLE